MAARKTHTFKLDEEPWQRFVAKAQQRKRSGSELINATIMLYLDEDEPANAAELDDAADTYEIVPSRATHTFKCDEDVWQRFLTKAKERQRSGSEIINAAIMLYLDENEPTNADELDKAADVYGTAGANGRPSKESIAS